MRVCWRRRGSGSRAGLDDGRAYRRGAPKFTFLAQIWHKDALFAHGLTHLLRQDLGMDRELLEGLLGEGMSLAAIGRRIGRHESTVAYWVELYGLRAVGADRYSARGGIARDELLALVEEGMSIAQIATAVDRSKTTVRHWLGRYGLTTTNRRGRRMNPVMQEARRAGDSEVQAVCPRHGETGFVRNGRGYYRCRKCRAEAVTRRRRKMKAMLVAEAGGSCRMCGYSGSMGALSFHHLNPAEKRFELNAKGVALALDTLRAEARKCVLLCSNCHAEVEERLRNDPDYRLDLSQT